MVAYNRMTDRIKDLEGDLAEFQRLLLEAERDNVQTYLSKHISALKTEVDTLTALKISQEPTKQAPPPISSPKTEIDRTKFQPLTKYAWDQEGPKINIIFSLDGVGTECAKEQVEVEFSKWSVEMRIVGYKQQSHIFAIKKLFGEINPTESKFLLKSNRVTLILVKKEKKSWDQLQFKEEKFGKDKEGEKAKEAKDPNAGIMDMMKKMYEDGDDNMKRTLAEAWSKANDKKGEKPDFSERMDFMDKQ